MMQHHLQRILCEQGADAIVYISQTEPGAIFSHSASLHRALVIVVEAMQPGLWIVRGNADDFRVERVREEIAN